MEEKNLVNTNDDVNLTKLIIKPGENDSKPIEGCWCTILCKTISTHQNLNDIHFGFKVNEETKIRIGFFSTEISRYINTAVETMRLNEIAEISFELNQKLVIPDEHNIKSFVFLDFKFQIELLDIDFSAAIHKIFSLNVDELINLANEHKNDANQIFKLNQVLPAFYRYSKAIKYLIIAQQIDKTEHDRDTSNIDVTDKKKIFDLKALLYLNIAACQLKYPNNSEHVIKNCTKCLEIDDKNVKALYRRALGYCDLNEFEKSIADLKHALQIDTHNKTVEEKLKYVEELNKKKDHDMADKLRKMFS